MRSKRSNRKGHRFKAGRSGEYRKNKKRSGHFQNQRLPNVGGKTKKANQSAPKKKKRGGGGQRIPNER